MTPTARIVYALALVIGLSCGAFCGFSNNANLLKSYYSLRRETAPNALDDFSFMQYRHADAEHARAALLAFAGLLEKLHAQSPDKEQERDLAYTYTRLALLEDSANNTQASQDFMAKAQYWNTTSGGKNYSDLEMKAAQNAMDDRLVQFGIR